MQYRFLLNSYFSLPLLSMVFSTGSWAGTITSTPPNPVPIIYTIGQIGAPATGGDLGRAPVFYQYQLGPDSYSGTLTYWAKLGSASGGISTAELNVTLSGSSYSQPFEITNVGTHRITFVEIGLSAVPVGAVFDTSSGLAYGSTTDGTDGTVIYSNAALSSTVSPSNTPYYFKIDLYFSGSGLSPGASASLFANVDQITPGPGTAPEPGTATLTVAAVVFLGVLATSHRKLR